jgi:hypothetical protein
MEGMFTVFSDRWAAQKNGNAAEDKLENGSRTRSG